MIHDTNAPIHLQQASLEGRNPEQHPQAPIEQFWREKMFTLAEPRIIKSEGYPQLLIEVGPNELEDYNACKAKEIRAFWTEGQSVVAYGRALLVGPNGGGEDSEEFLFEMDTIGQDFSDLADLLIKTHRDNNPLSSSYLDEEEPKSKADAKALMKEIFNGSAGFQWLAEFQMLEVHPEQRGKGLGAKLGLQFMTELEKAFEIAFFALKPYPLQYSKGDGPRQFYDRNNHADQFEKDKQKLKSLYMKAWGAHPLPGSEEHLYIQAKSRFQLCVSEDQKTWHIKKNGTAASSH